MSQPHAWTLIHDNRAEFLTTLQVSKTSLVHLIYWYKFRKLFINSNSYFLSFFLFYDPSSSIFVGSARAEGSRLQPFLEISTSLLYLTAKIICYLLPGFLGLSGHSEVQQLVQNSLLDFQKKLNPSKQPSG